MDLLLESRLRKHLPNLGLLAKPKQHVIDDKNAKRIRPKLVFATGDLFGITKADLLDRACVVEFIHAASLLHDDIADGTVERRGQPSVNAAYGNGVALLAGDSLLAVALTLLANDTQSSKAIPLAARTIMTMSEAAAYELTLRNQKVTTEQLLQVVDGKTGALFGLCCALGALDADVPGDPLIQLGTFIGRAFQLRDDIDDIEEDRGNNIPTIASLLGAEATEQYVVSALEQAAAILKEYATPQLQQAFMAQLYTMTRTAPVHSVA